VGIQRFPNLLRGTVPACRLPYPGGPKSARDCCFLFGGNFHPSVTGSAATLVVSRLQSSLRADFAPMLRPASWLALLSRTFTFELALAGSPRANVEYDYVGKQSIPTTGLSPASPTALWAAEQSLTPGSSVTPRSSGVFDSPARFRIHLRQRKLLLEKAVVNGSRRLCPTLTRRFAAWLASDANMRRRLKSLENELDETDNTK
jgi:hypothetical protein